MDRGWKYTHTQTHRDMHETASIFKSIYRKKASVTDVSLVDTE